MDGKERQRRYLALIQKYRLIDDTFMSVVFQDKACAQLLIRCILERDDLTITEVRTQQELRNLWGRSIRLDILAADEYGTRYNIEVQQSRGGALEKRARYHSSLLDAGITEPGDRYEALAETYVIFITEKDFFGQALPLYHVDRVIREMAKPFSDGAHIIYVNGQYRGGDALGALMHDFFCEDPAQMQNGLLAENVRYYKQSPEGVKLMCEISEKIHQEGRKEGRREGLAQGRADTIRRMMERMHLSFGEACELLAIPKEERTRVEKFLQ